MKALVLKPELVIPWHHENTYETLMQRALEEKEMGRGIEALLNDAQEYLSLTPHERMRRRNDREMKGWKYVQPVPVFDAPEELLSFGSYVALNGHNRRAAAKEAGIMLPVLLIEQMQDIVWLNDSDEGVLMLMTLLEHKAYVCNRAMEYLHSPRQPTRVFPVTTTVYKKQAL